MTYKFIDTPHPKTGKPQHLHTLDGDPLFGTSTVLQILSKPLTWWASGLAVSHLGWSADGKTKAEKLEVAQARHEKAETHLKRIQKMNVLEYLDLLSEAYRAHSVKLDTSAEAGTDMHAELEKYVKACIEKNAGVPMDLGGNDPSDDAPIHRTVLLFAEWSMDNVKRFIASEAYCYSERLWTGGITDLIYEDVDGNYVLLDFKSAKAAYDTHFLQNAGYDIALSANGILTKDGDLVKKLDRPFSAYGVLPFGMDEPVPQFRTDVEALKRGFEHCVHLYGLLKQTGAKGNG